MKAIKTLFFLAVIWVALAFTYCKEQPFHVIKATSQRWAGGVAGRWGINYYIEIETKSRTEIPDTVWINGKVYPLVIQPKGGNTFRSIDSINHEIKYVIMVGESNNQFAAPPNRLKNNQAKDSATEKPKPVRQFEGAAMVSYIVRHKQHFLIIKTLTELRTLNYP